MYNARRQILNRINLLKGIHITSKQGNVSFQIGPYETSLLLRVTTFRNRDLLTTMKHYCYLRRVVTFAVSLLSEIYPGL